jgi:hypothetical protein
MRWNLSDWIEHLQNEKETKAELEAMEEDKQRQGQLLVAAKAPDLWNTLVSLIDRDVRKLADAFPGQESMTLQFDRDLADKIMVTNTSTRKSFTAQWASLEGIIKLTFRERELNLEGVQTNQDQMSLLVLPSGDVVMMWAGESAPEKISEVLLRGLLEEHAI